VVSYGPVSSCGLKQIFTNETVGANFSGQFEQGEHQCDMATKRKPQEFGKPRDQLIPCKSAAEGLRLSRFRP